MKHNAFTVRAQSGPAFAFILMAVVTFPFNDTMSSLSHLSPALAFASTTISTFSPGSVTLVATATVLATAVVSEYNFYNDLRALSRRLW